MKFSAPKKTWRIFFERWTLLEAVHRDRIACVTSMNVEYIHSGKLT